MVPKNSTTGGFAYIWQKKLVGIIVIKTERTKIHFLSDVLVTVASLDLKVHNNKAKLRRDDHESAEFTYRIGVDTKPDKFSWQRVVGNILLFLQMLMPLLIYSISFLLQIASRKTKENSQRCRRTKRLSNANVLRAGRHTSSPQSSFLLVYWWSFRYQNIGS